MSPALNKCGKLQRLLGQIEDIKAVIKEAEHNVWQLLFSAFSDVKREQSHKG